MRAGKRDCRITLQEPVFTKDARGSQVISYRDVGDEWAEQMPLNSTEVPAAPNIVNEKHLVGISFAKWNIQYRTDVTNQWRFTFDNGGNIEHWEIIGKQRIGRNEGLQLQTKLVDEK